MKKVINCVRFNGLNILEQLRYEELLLRNTKDNWFIFNYGTTVPTIVLGLSGKVIELVNIERVREDKIPMVRRYTGGGTVIVDKNTVFSTLIMNSSDAKTQPYPREIMNRSDKHIYQRVFSDLIKEKGIQFALREHDYVLNDVKCGGNAQTITKDRWVHHTSFLWDYSLNNMNYLALPKKRPQYRGDRNHNDFLTKLNKFIDNIDTFHLQIVTALSDEYEVKTVDENDLNQIIRNILNNRKWDESTTRTMPEDINLYTVKNKLESLVKQGPSCVNL